MKKLLVILMIICSVMSCGHMFELKYKDVYKVRVGMTWLELSVILPDMRPDEYNAPNELRFGNNYVTEGGRKSTFWVIMNDSIVTNFYSL